jgi:hypothetical protein
MARPLHGRCRRFDPAIAYQPRGTNDAAIAWLCTTGCLAPVGHLKNDGLSIPRAETVPLLQGKTQARGVACRAIVRSSRRIQPRRN